MKKFTLIFLFIVCKIGLAQSVVLNGKDSTLNMLDVNGKRQGKWIITGKLANLPDYGADAKVEEGKYLNSLKIGIWKHYFPNGNLQNKLTYENNRPNGYAVMYHDNGKISEEGNWKNNRWVGNYKLYYENGQVQQSFTFNETGKREGKQEYYYENGEKMIEGEWKEGREDGVIKEYYENGDLKAEKSFNGGNLDTDPSKTKTYAPKQPIAEKKEVAAPAAPAIATTISKNEQIEGGKASTSSAPVNLATITGQATIYNKNRQISKSGMFANGKLISGKVYIYNDNGILNRIAVYENSQYKGDAPIEGE
jgi:antitoxin component YwqK of YwqJK toxin-antitoxin module